MSSTRACATDSGAAALLHARAAALQQGDFAFIYRSYHPSAPFLRFFPDVVAYQAFGRDTLAGTVQLLSCEVLREDIAAGEARLLVRHTFMLGSETLRQLEIVVCLPTPDGWRYRSGLKLDNAQLPADLRTADWNELEQAGDGVWL